MNHKKWLIGAGLLALSAALAQGSGPLLFISTQFAQLEEVQRVKDVVLKGAPVAVDFVAQDGASFSSRLQAEQKAGKVTVSLAGGLHGDFAGVPAPTLDNLDDIAAKLKGRGIPSNLMTLGKLGTKNQKYIPWAQATYVMVANKQALPYLPAGADLNNLTYKQLIQWGKNIFDKTGQKRLGFPAGPNGLIHRFVQGFLLPSYAGTTVKRFKSPLAESAWKDMKALWSYSNPQSSGYNFMQEPLLSGEVWVAWDHVARLKDAVTQKPNDFVAFPVPSGPRGRGYMPVVVGLAIPAGAPNRAGAAAMIDFLTKPAAQAATLRENAFFPVIDGDLPGDLSQGIKLLAGAVNKQLGKGSVVALLPVGLGAQNGEFNKIYIDTFQRIILRNQAIPDALSTEADALNKIMDTANVPCWAPDSGPAPCEAE